MNTGFINTKEVKVALKACGLGFKDKDDRNKFLKHWTTYKADEVDDQSLVGTVKPKISY